MLLSATGVAILHAFVYRLMTLRGKVNWYERRSALLGMVLMEAGYGVPIAAIFISTRLDEALALEYVAQVYMPSVDRSFSGALS